MLGYFGVYYKLFGGFPLYLTYKRLYLSIELNLSLLALLSGEFYLLLSEGFVGLYALDYFLVNYSLKKSL